VLYSGITEQTKASVHRLDDARALLREQRWRGSMYLAGYAIECQLKAKLMQNHQDNIVDSSVVAAYDI